MANSASDWSEARALARAMVDEAVDSLERLVGANNLIHAIRRGGGAMLAAPLSDAAFSSLLALLDMIERCRGELHRYDDLDPPNLRPEVTELVAGIAPSVTRLDAREAEGTAKLARVSRYKVRDHLRAVDWARVFLGRFREHPLAARVREDVGIRRLTLMRSHIEGMGWSGWGLALAPRLTCFEFSRAVGVCPLHTTEPEAAQPWHWTCP